MGSLTTIRRPRRTERPAAARRSSAGRPVRGLNVKLLTNEGSPMIVSYSTSPAGGSQQHTGTQLRVAGYGPGAANLSGLIDQTDLFFVMHDAMNAWDRCAASRKQSC